MGREGCGKTVVSFFLGFPTAGKKSLPGEKRKENAGRVPGTLLPGNKGGKAKVMYKSELPGPTCEGETMKV